MKKINMEELFPERKNQSYNVIKEKFITAYQKKDFTEQMYQYFVNAHSIWVKEWRKQGSKDEGTCTGGRGITITFLYPRCKYPKWNYKIVDAPPVQGNISASKSVKPALKYLQDKGIECEYFDGWMN